MFFLVFQKECGRMSPVARLPGCQVARAPTAEGKAPLDVSCGGQWQASRWSLAALVEAEAAGQQKSERWACWRAANHGGCCMHLPGPPGNAMAAMPTCNACWSCPLLRLLCGLAGLACFLVSSMSASVAPSEGWSLRLRCGDWPRDIWMYSLCCVDCR